MRATGQLDEDEAKRLFEIEDLFEAVKSAGCQETLLKILAEFVRNKSKLQSKRLEMEYAWEVFQTLLPPSTASFENYEVSGLLIPAKDVGGDIYDYFTPGDSRIGFLLADASGKGTGPCLQAATCRAYFRALVSTGNTDLSEIALQLNRLIFADVKPAKFLTACFGWIEMTTNTIHFVNAGHGSGFFSCSSGASIFEEPDLPLGVFEEAEYRCQTRVLEVGDTLAVFTDGWTERKVAEDEEYGEKNLELGLQRAYGESSHDTLRKIYQAFEVSCRDFPQADDVTAMFLRRRA